MANITEKLNVGDKVYVSTKYNYLLAKVVKKTPAGKVDVTWGTDAYSNKRFRADGTLDSADSFDRDRYHLDHLTVPERQAEMAKEQRAKVAVDKIRAIEPEQRLRWEWGQESLQKEVDRLQGLLDEAKMAVRAIQPPDICLACGQVFEEGNGDPRSTQDCRRCEHCVATGAEVDTRYLPAEYQKFAVKENH